MGYLDASLAFGETLVVFGSLVYGIDIFIDHVNDDTKHFIGESGGGIVQFIFQSLIILLGWLLYAWMHVQDLLKPPNFAVRLFSCCYVCLKDDEPVKCFICVFAYLLFVYLLFTCVFAYFYLLFTCLFIYLLFYS